LGPVSRDRVLALILAGGKGERLGPLTRERSKPAVPFGGRYRIVDFVLSNFVNSGILAIYVLVQYKAQSLIEHLRSGWRTGGILTSHFITVVPPQMRRGDAWYQGTADAVLQNLDLIDDFDPSLVAVFGADHIYRMDINQLIAAHRDRAADLTIAARPVALAEATQFGVIEVDGTGRVMGFQEKPAAPRPMPGDPTRAYVSLGNYIFTRRALVEILLAAEERRVADDFGKSILPALLRTHRVFAYDFQDNAVPGIKPYEEPGYWRDVGSVETYWRAHLDLLGEQPVFDLDNREWPILTEAYQGPPARIIAADIDDVHLGAGSMIKRATVRHSIVGRNVTVHEGAIIEDSVVMDHTSVGKGARLHRVIVDRFNVIGSDQEIGVDPEDDRQRYHVDGSGIVVIPRGGRRDYLWRARAL
jgi:glucose-1-phosphate adenylyltransferase